MTAVQILASLGFVGSSVVNEAKVKGRTLVCCKVWTAKGWAYEKFDKTKLEDEITAWSRTVQPGVWK